MRRLLLIGAPVLLVGVLVGGDVAVRHVAESRVESAVTDRLTGAHDVSVEVGGWPVTVDLVRGELHDVTVHLVVPFSAARDLLQGSRSEGSEVPAGFDLENLEVEPGGLAVTVHADELDLP